MKRFIAILIGLGLCLSFAAPALGSNTPFVLHVPVLMYHHIQCEVPEGKGAGNYVCPSRFEATLKLFKARGWQTVTAAQLADAMVNHVCLPPKTFVFTFDDGGLDGYTNAYPLLLKYGFTATFAVIVQSVGNYVTDPSAVHPHFSWDQAREMVANGMDVDNHTMTHRPIGHMDDSELDYQVMDAQDAFNQELGYYPNTFVYPYGSVGTAPAYLASHGFELAFTDPGVEHYPNGAYESTADPMRALRVRINRSYSPTGIVRWVHNLSKPCEGD